MTPRITYNTSSFLFLLLSLFLSLSFVSCSLRELNVGNAELLCNSSCSFYDTRIWDNGIVPQDGDDVQILYFASSIGPLTINLTTSITLNNLDIEGDVVLFVSGVSFAVKNVILVGAAYTTEVQCNGSDVNIRSLSLNGADFLSSYSGVTLDSMTVANVSSVAIVQTDFYCGACHLSDITVDLLSTFSAGNVTLTSQHSNFTGYTYIADLSVQSQVVFYNASLGRVTVEENANLIAHGYLEMSQINLMPMAIVVLANASQVNVAPYSSSYVSGLGSFFLRFTKSFSFGSSDAQIDMSSVEIQLFDGNNGTFENVIFGALSVNAPASVVLLRFTQVIFTDLTELYGNISVSGMVVEKPLTVLGPIICTDGVTLINAPIICSKFSQERGFMEISQALTVDPLQIVNLTNIAFNVTDVSKITGDVLFINSTAEVHNSLNVIGSWASDNNTIIELPSLSPNCAPRLNVSGDLYIDSTINFALSETPSSKSEYPLFTYGGVVQGTFVSNFTVPNVTHGVFVVQYTDGAVTLVYTPHKKKFSGAPLYGTIAGAVAGFIVLVVIFAFIIRRFLTNRRKYEVIPS